MMLLHLADAAQQPAALSRRASVTLSVLGAEPMQLPVASCPCDDRNLQFHIERDSDHSFAERVFHSLGQGDAVTVWGTMGGLRAATGVDGAPSCSWFATRASPT
ncbi:MAG: hypothetical protein MZW92_47830 [Comamonadaceae bacterium]|nr:hypothetical protein [Comamonadaceae bacterium]